MGIGFYRDIAIIIAGLVAAGVLVFMAVLLYSLYKRTIAILDSMQAASANVRGITSYMGVEVVKPLTEMVALIHGIRKGSETVSNLFRKKEGGKDV